MIGFGFWSGVYRLQLYKDCKVETSSDDSDVIVLVHSAVIDT